MKHLSLFLTTILIACGAGNNSGTNNSTKTSVMADNKIEIEVNGEKTIQLPSRASSGLRVVFTVSDSSVVSVTRKDLQSSDVDSLHLRPGDPIPAIFIIKGIKKGNTLIHFAERKPGVNDGSDIPLKDFDVKVGD